MIWKTKSLLMELEWRRVYWMIKIAQTPFLQSHAVRTILQSSEQKVTFKSILLNSFNAEAKIHNNQIEDCGIFFYYCSRENYCWPWNKWAWNSNMCIQSDICGWFKRGKNVNHLPSLQKWVRFFSFPTMKFVINQNTTLFDNIN